MTKAVEDAGAFDYFLDGATPEVPALARALRRTILDASPNAVESFDPSDGVLGFGSTRTLRDLCLAIVPHKAHVNVQLVDGLDLPNPHGKIEGTGKRARHVKVRLVADIAAPWVVDAIDAQIAHRLPPR